MIDLLTELSEKDYDEEDRKTFTSELNSAITHLQWIKENMASKFNSAMTATVDGHSFRKTCNMVAAHIIGMSKAETARPAAPAFVDANQNDVEWPAHVYPSIPESNDAETNASISASTPYCEHDMREQDMSSVIPNQETAFGNRRSDLTKDNVAKLTKSQAQAWKARIQA